MYKNGQKYFEFKEAGTGEFEGMLLTPHADPMLYEYPVDQIFETEDDALEFKTENYPDEEFILCETVVSAIRVVPAEEEE